MGAGKTTFIHALCKVLNVKNAVSSPTFAIINEYKSVDAGIIYHMDLYRIKNEKEAVEAGIEDCLLSGNFCLVEWPDKIPGLLPDNSLQIFIDVNDNKTRRLYLG
jgi:tRNA threonylcarbamoyladenosine biosynthesis protein TsaE